jgi:hypothetical protein
VRKPRRVWINLYWGYGSCDPGKCYLTKKAAEDGALSMSGREGPLEFVIVPKKKGKVKK